MKAEEPAPEPDSPEEPAAADPPAEDEPKTDDDSPASEEAPVPQDPPDDNQEADEGPRKLIDFSNKQHLIVLGIGGTMVLVALVIIILLFAGF